MAAKNEISNANIDFIQKKVFVPAGAFLQANTLTTVLDAGFGSGQPSYVQLGASHIGATRFQAVTDEIDFLWVPADFDNRQKLLIRYLWTSNYAVGGGTARFDTLYGAHSTGTAVSLAATALTVLPAVSTKTFATARALYWSKYGQVGPIATGVNAQHTFAPDTIALSFNVKVGAVTGITIATDFVFILGVELTYTPRLAFGNNTRPGRLLMDGLHATVELNAANDL